MVKSSDEPLIEFNPELPRLSSNERAVLNLLTDAGKGIALIYKLQENPVFPGASFYPRDVPKDVITRSAGSNPKILSPYTVVEKVAGGLTAIPYHKKYGNLLRPIAQKLEEAAALTENGDFGRYLKVQSEALIQGSYAKAVVAKLKTKPYILDISIGPIDYFDDQLFFVKASYQAWVGVLDKEGTARLNNYKSIILSSKRRAFVPTERIDNYDKVKAKVLNVVLFSGLITRTKFVGVNYPVNVGIVKKYGSEITLFNQLNDLRMEEQIAPVFAKIFPKGFKEGYSYEDLRRGNLRYIAMHELAHSYLYYKHAAENLKDLFNPIYELAATVLGFRMAGSLLLKDRITNKQLESIIVAFLCRNFFLMGKKQVSKTMTEYKIGAALFINFLLEAGALKESQGAAIPNFIKIFVALQDLFRVLERLLSRGSRAEAEAFIERYGIKRPASSSPQIEKFLNSKKVN